MLELLVVAVVVKGQNWYSVVYIESKAGGTVVDYYQVFNVAVGNNAQVFHQAEGSLNAVLTVQTMRKYVALLIQKVKDGVSVELIARCECDNLELFLEVV